MNKEDNYENIIRNIEIISESSNKTIEAIKEASLNSLNQISSIYDGVRNDSRIFEYTNNLSKIIDSYRDVVSKCYMPSTIDVSKYSESMVNILAETENISTNFTRIIRESLINSDYNRLLNSINETINDTYINLQNLIFLKTSDLISDALCKINAPSGLASSIKELNKYSTNRLIDNKQIVYDTSKKLFIDKDNVAASSSSKEMNIICSTMYLFEDSGDYELFSEEELMNFLNILEDRRTLAIDNTTGKKIYNFIKNLKPTINFDAEIYYHARTRNIDECPFTNYDMLCAPTGIVNPGRYNFAGQSFYYFTDCIEGCLSEMRKHSNKNTVQIAMIRPVKSISMIDLSGKISHAKTLLRYIRFPRGEESIPRAYLLPCFISDCCRDVGIEGIKYRGSEKYSNYVCWNSGYFKFIKMLSK